MRIEISMITATYKRPDEIANLLVCVEQQTYPLKEIIIVDASPDTEYHEVLRRRFSHLPLQFISSSPSVCAQRNIGISCATGEWIFICDDDISFPSNYVEKLAIYLKANSSCGVVTGTLLQKNSDELWVANYPITRWFHLLWNFVFQLPLWGPIELKSVPFITRSIFNKIVAYYHERGNTTTLGGWPLITDWKGAVIKTQFYSLGTNIVRRNWLIKNLFDEVLDTKGIGDNYGVEANFPDAASIHILNDLPVKHHLSKIQRIPTALSYYRRILALAYFNERRDQKSSGTKGWLLWSLIGNTISFTFKGRWLYLRATVKAFYLILVNRNPYTEAKLAGKRVNDFYF